MNKEIAECLLNWDEHEEEQFFEEITNPEIIGKSRWYLQYSQIFRDTRDSSYWEIVWSRGATENQDEGPESINVFRVEPQQVTITSFVRVKDN